MPWDGDVIALPEAKLVELPGGGILWVSADKNKQPRPQPQLGDAVVAGPWLFRMRNDLFNLVGVIDDGKVKAPILVDACLPEILRFVVLLGPQGTVVKVVG